MIATPVNVITPGGETIRFQSLRKAAQFLYMDPTNVFIRMKRFSVAEQLEKFGEAIYREEAQRDEQS